MRTPGLVEPAHQFSMTGLEEYQPAGQVFVGLELAILTREVTDKARLANVDHDRHAIVFGLPFGQLRHHRQQRHRQVVDAVVAEILE
jgi:hypothetical protein